MAGLKRGGFRGGAGGAFKKGAPKKRAASDDEEDVPRAGKKSKGGEDETSAPVIPELKEDDQGDSYISVSFRFPGWIVPKLKCEAQRKRQATRHDQRIQGRAIDQYTRVLDQR